jgi:hypothetical protein
MQSFSGVIVLGPYRSGTSVTAQILKALGYDFGPKRHMIPASKENPGGFYERKDINNANDALIASAGGNSADPGDPRQLADKADRGAFNIADLSWLKSTARWGIKDPRMCATLLAWVDLGVLDRNQICIVHVRRELEGAVRSGMAFGPIRAYCDGTEAGVRSMLSRYAELAQWHVDTLNIPTFTIAYEQLIKEPNTVIAKLGEFLGIRDAARIKRAASLIGKGKGMFALQLERYLIRAPRRLVYLLTGRNPDGTLRSPS